MDAYSTPTVVVELEDGILRIVTKTAGVRVVIKDYDCPQEEGDDVQEDVSGEYVRFENTVDEIIVNCELVESHSANPR